jgi:hypothetical protein
MAELSLHQVERIKKDLIRDSISYSHLFHDLLDHICCDIEFEMDRGISFEDAYTNIKRWMGRNRCRKIQEETLLLTNNTYRFMKSIMKIFGIISPALLAVAALFKIQHWPGAGILMVLGFFLLCIFFLPSAIYVLYKENKGKRFVLYLFGFVSFFPWMAGVLFKVQHWPSASILLTIGILATVVLFLPTLLYVKIKDASTKELNPVLTIGVISGMIYLTGLLFKIMHWPGAGLMFCLGSLFFVVIFLPYYTIKTYKEDQHVRFEFIFLLVGVLWFILTTTLFNLNISRDVISDFTDNYENLNVLNKQMMRKNADLYLLAERTLDDMNKVKEIQNRTNQLTEYINELKSDLIKSCSENSDLRSMDNQDISIRQIAYNTDYRKPSAFMCGKESNGKAYELKSRLTDYKLFINDLVSNEEIMERNNKLIDLDVPSDSPSDIKGWEEYYFGKVILVTALDILTNYQLRIKITESELIQYILNDSHNIKTEYTSTLMNQ